MLNNITNFFNIFKGKMTKTAPTEGDILVLGTRDARFGGHYKPTAILAEDFLAFARSSWGNITGTLSAQNDLQNALDSKQATLISATNIKTINGNSVLGSGNLVAGLPAWVETNATDLTIWNNGKGNVASNTSFGDSALKFNTTGTYNVAVGYRAMENNTNGYSNTAIGSESLSINTTGINNVAIGSAALYLNTASNNVGIGLGALTTNTTGYKNIAVGTYSMILNSNGYSNVGIGFDTLYNNTTGYENTVVGIGSLNTNTTGYRNVSIGCYSSVNSTTGTYNVAIGFIAFNANTTGSDNVAIGTSALFRNTTGNGNTAVGRNALLDGNGLGNTALGYGTYAGNFNYSVILGYNAAATASNQFVVGSSTQNAGAVTTETITANRTWTVRINGANYKIPMVAI